MGIPLEKLVQLLSSRWKIWARATCPELPIISSNAIVESLWSQMKKRYIRKSARPKLEFLVDIIMNQHLPNLAVKVKQHRNMKDPDKPDWCGHPNTLSDGRYLQFVRSWKINCKRVKDEFVKPENADVWLQQQAVHKSSIQQWWCGCPSFFKSPYHICKHLIRLYIGEEGLLSNKPRMPFYGEVWRQSSHPLLWVAGVHDVSLLKVRDLQLQPQTLEPSSQAPPVLVSAENLDHGTSLDDLDEPFRPVLEIEPAIYDSDDEEEDEDEDEDEDQRDEDTDSDDRNTIDGRTSDYTEDGLGFGDGDNFEDDSEIFSQQEEKAEAVLDSLQEMAADFKRGLEAVEDAMTYLITHPRFWELPRMHRGNAPNVLDWAEKWDRLKRARKYR